MVKITDIEKNFKQDHLTRPLIKYFYHKITIWSSWLFVKLGLHENAVTFLSFVFALISALMIYYLNGVWLILAGVLFAYGVVIDLADGTVARYYKHKSAMGEWLDEAVGFMSFFVVFLAMMLKGFRDTSDIWIIVLGAYNIFSYMMINYAALISAVLREKYKLENPVQKIREKASKNTKGTLNPGAFAFSLDVQWTLVGLGIALASTWINAPYFLFISFGIISSVQWMARFWVFWGK
jgi:phosphatidylglycerophosphate synthase